LKSQHIAQARAGGSTYIRKKWRIGMKTCSRECLAPVVLAGCRLQRSAQITVWSTRLHDSTMHYSIAKNILTYANFEQNGLAT
jgi:hypothetical protein